MLAGLIVSATAPFFAQNNSVAARAFDLSWYAMAILILGSFFYILGAFSKKQEAFSFKKLLAFAESSVVLLFIAMLPVMRSSGYSIQVYSIKTIVFLKYF